MVGNVLAIWLIFGRLFTETRSKMTYYLSQDCQVPLKRDSLHPYSDTRHLRVDNLDGGLILQSHDWRWPPNHQLGNHSHLLGAGGGSNQTYTTPLSSYPRGFSCEIVVHTPVENAKIMMRIEEFYVPSASEDCVENYVYVFDSNTAKSKAMPEAGGERGLCRASYPRQPIFTSKSYICIAFYTSAHPPAIPPNHKPGFRVVLTTIHDTTTSTCQAGQFYCGTRPRATHTDSKSHLTQQSMPFANLLSFGSSSASSSSSAILGSTGSLTDTISLSATGTGAGSTSTDKDPNRIASLGYCIPERTVCDGIGNCADSRDESVTRCGSSGSVSGDGRQWQNGERKTSGWLLGFLSLGVPASIAIAVSTIVTFTICIGAIICCCNRCCCRPHPYRSRYPRIVADGASRLTALDSSSAPGNPGGYRYHQHPHQRVSGSSSAVVLGAGTRTHLASWLNRGRHIPSGPAAWNPHLPFSSTTAYAPPFCSYAGVSQPGSVAQLFSTAGPHLLPADQKSGAAVAYRTSALMDQQGGTVTQQQFAMRKGVRADFYAGSEQQSAAAIGPRFMSSVGPPSSDSYSSIHANSSGQAGYTVYPRPPGPPPALMHGAMGSPLTFRRDTSGTDPFCYTPPPYGACTVPPASSVTASSSRTGTTSGGIGVTGATHTAVWPPRGVMTAESGLITAGGSMDGASAADLCPTGSNGILFGHQLSGGGNSVLHTNTPVETISQGGGGDVARLPVTSGDMISNGGILYLGELPQPNDASSNRYRGFVCGGPGSTTTGSGSSHGRKLRSHARRRLMLQECQPVQHSSQLDCNSAQSQHRVTGDSSVSASQRSRVPSNRPHHQHHSHLHHPHRRRYHHRPSDPTRTVAASSGSHTPASSRSGMPTTSSQRSGESSNPQLTTLPTSVTTVSFPVQL